MSQPLPPPRNLESLKKEAKRWLAALRAGEAPARGRLRGVYPDAPATPVLRDVQHALALEHGFDGWTLLKAAIEQRSAAAAETGASALALYEAKADALLEAYRTGTPEAMQRHYRHTWHRRAWPVMRTYVQLDLGKRPAHPGDEVEITRDDARYLVAREHGFASWHALEAFTASLRPGRRVTAKPLRLMMLKEPDHWEAVAASRDWEEVLELLAQHPAAGLSGEGQLTDDLLEDLSHHAGALTALGLPGCRQVTDEGIRHLAAMPALRYLDLSGTSVTDAGLEVLRHLRELRTLSISWNGTTPSGIGALAHCDELEQLMVWGPDHVGDAVVRALAGKPGLRHLTIALTDAGIPWLRELPVFRSWQETGPEVAPPGHKPPPNHLSLRGSSPTWACSTCTASTVCSASTSTTAGCPSPLPACNR